MIFHGFRLRLLKTYHFPVLHPHLLISIESMSCPLEPLCLDIAYATPPAFRMLVKVLLRVYMALAKAEVLRM